MLTGAQGHQHVYSLLVVEHLAQLDDVGVMQLLQDLHLETPAKHERTDDSNKRLENESKSTKNKLTVDTEIMTSGEKKTNGNTTAIRGATGLLGVRTSGHGCPPFKWWQLSPSPSRQIHD